MMTRAEHLEWCKQRAREYLDTGDVQNAVTSMMSDLAKHPELKLDPGSVLIRLAILAAMRHDREMAQRFIEGFH